MPSVIFNIDSLASLFVFLFAALFFLAWRWRKTFSTPQLYFSSLDDLQSKQVSWKQRVAKLPSYLLMTSLFLFGLAMADPHLLMLKGKKPPPLKQHVPTEGIAIYLVLDQSGSMKERIEGGHLTKIEILKNFTRDFIKGRPNDLIGLIFFARTAQIEAPLTLDHNAILDRLSHFAAVQKEEEDGTSIGYALFKAVNLIAATREYAQNLPHNERPPYKIKNAIIILVTDGFQSPSPLDRGRRLRNIDVDEAAEFAKQHDVKIYIVNVDPRLAVEEFAPYRKLMQKSAAITGGRFFMAEDASSLEKIFSDIDRLEKSTLPTELGYSPSEMLRYYSRVSFFPYLIGLGMACLLLSVLLSGTLLRRVP